MATVPLISIVPVPEKRTIFCAVLFRVLFVLFCIDLFILFVLFSFVLLVLRCFVLFCCAVLCWDFFFAFCVLCCAVFCVVYFV